MRNIRYIVFHCTATQANVRVSSILRYWREKLKWKNPGYHFIVDSQGSTTQLQELNKVANGVKGYNTNAIHVCYIGGIDVLGKAKDTRTSAQKIGLEALAKSLKAMFPNAKMQGHRDFKGVNKACPSFDVKKWLKEIKI